MGRQCPGMLQWEWGQAYGISAAVTTQTYKRPRS